MLVLPPTILVNPLSAPINASAARKGSEGGLFNIKSIEGMQRFNPMKLYNISKGVRKFSLMIEKRIIVHTSAQN